MTVLARQAGVLARWAWYNWHAGRVPYATKTDQEMGITAELQTTVLGNV